MININSVKKDILASVIVFLVAMPLAIGISIACGLPVYCGIISGIIGGIVVGALSGNSLQVSGPAAGLILIVVDIINNLGIEKLFLIIFLVGLIQILFGFLSLGKWFRAISPAIIQGMLAGIGISIFLSQFHIMLDSKPQNSFIENILDLGRVIYHSVLPLNGSNHHLASMVGIPFAVSTDCAVNSSFLLREIRAISLRLQDFPFRSLTITSAKSSMEDPFNNTTLSPDFSAIRSFGTFRVLISFR